MQATDKNGDDVRYFNALVFGSVVTKVTFTFATKLTLRCSCK